MLFLLAVPVTLSAETWSGTKRVQTNYVIPAGTVLTIEPGTTVLLDPEVKIIVNGRLNAVGTPSDSITFTWFSTNIRWNGIEISNTGNAELAYCQIKNTRTALGALNIAQNSPFEKIIHCLFENNEGGAVYFQGSTIPKHVIIKHNIFRGGNSFGILFRGGSFYSIRIEDNKIQGDLSKPGGFSGVRIDRTVSDSILFNYNVIRYAYSSYSSQHPGAALIIESPQVSDVGRVKVTNCRFQESEGLVSAVNIKAAFVHIDSSEIIQNYGSFGGGSYISGNQIRIENSLFSNNGILSTSQSGGGGLIIDAPGTKGSAIVRYCRFESNRIKGYNGAGIRITGNQSQLNDLIIENCLFKSNFSNINGGAVSISGFDTVRTVRFSDCDFIRNEAQGGKGGSGIFADAVVQIGKMEIIDSRIGYHSSPYGNGGFLSLNSEIELIKKLTISNNVAGDSLICYGSGGFLHSSAAGIDEVLFTGNTFTKTKSGDSGGIAFIQHGANTVMLRISSNKFGNVASGGDGGSIFFSGKFLNEAIFTGNQFAISTAAGSGGSIYLHADTMKHVSFAGNHIETSRSKTDGGSIYLSGILKDRHFSLELADNEVTVSESVSGNGGFLTLSGSVHQDVVLKNNIFGAITSGKNGGLINMGDQVVDTELFHFANNYITDKATSGNGSGGVVYGTGNLNILQIQNNKGIKTTSAYGDGGGFFWVDKDSVDVVFKGNDIAKSTSVNGSGGLLFLSADAFRSVQIVGNYLGINTAGIHGGGFNILPDKGGIDTLRFESNLVKGGLAGKGDGGLLRLETPANIRFLSYKGNAQALGEYLAGGNGGVLSVEADEIATFEFSGNTLGGSATATNGAVIHLKAEMPRFSSGELQSLMIKDNVSRANLNALGNGGFLHYEGQNNQNLLIANNSFSGNVTAKGIGGLFSFRNSGGHFNSVLFLENSYKPAVPAEKLNAAKGGFVGFEGEFSADSIHFINNIFESVNASLSGSIMHLEGELRHRLSVRENIVRNVLVTGNGALGGALFIDNKELLNEIWFNSNHFDQIRVNQGPGALMHYAGPTIQSVVVSNNKANNLHAGKGGAIQLAVNNLQSLLSIDNQWTNLQGNSGGLYHIKGDHLSVVGRLLLEKDKVENSYTAAGGGVVYLDISKVDSVELSGITALQCVSGMIGGFLGTRDGIELNHLLINNSFVEENRAEENGGFLSLSGIVGEIRAEGNNFVANSARKSGGTFDINDQGRHGIMVAEENEFTGIKTKLSGEGGALYMVGLDSVMLNNNLLQNLQAGKGGALMSKDIRNLTISNSQFRYNSASITDGGALHIDQAGLFTSRRNEYSGNMAAYGFGGAFYVNASEVKIAGDTIAWNNAVSGAGSYLLKSSGSFDSLYFYKNSAIDPSDRRSEGGALYMKDTGDPYLRMRDIRMYGNHAYAGGGIYAVNSKTDICRIILAYNSAHRDGAAGFFVQSDDIKVTNGIVFENSVPGGFANNPTAGFHFSYITPNKLSPSFINCSFRANNSFALGITTNTAYPLPEYSRIKIMNSIIYYNGFNTTAFNTQYSGPADLYEISYSNVESLDTKRFTDNNIDERPGWWDNFSFCLFMIGNNQVDGGNPDPAYNDRPNSTGKSYARNDMGATGGPCAFANCTDTRVDYVTYKPDVSLTAAESELVVYPNPARGLVYIQPGDETRGDVHIEVYNSYGSLIYSRIFNGTMPGAILDVQLEMLPKGMYLIQLRNAGLKKSTKLILM